MSWMKLYSWQSYIAICYYNCNYNLCLKMVNNYKFSLWRSYFMTVLQITGNQCGNTAPPVLKALSLIMLWIWNILRRIRISFWVNLAWTTQCPSNGSIGPIPIQCPSGKPKKSKPFCLFVCLLQLSRYEYELHVPNGQLIQLITEWI